MAFLSVDTRGGEKKGRGVVGGVLSGEQHDLLLISACSPLLLCAYVDTCIADRDRNKDQSV